MNERTYFYQENPTKFYAHLIDTFLVQHYMRRISTFNRVKCFLKKENLTSHLEILCTVFRERLCNLKPCIRLIGFYFSQKHKLSCFITLWLLMIYLSLMFNYFVV